MSDGRSSPDTYQPESKKNSLKRNADRYPEQDATQDQQTKKQRKTHTYAHTVSISTPNTTNTATLADDRVQLAAFDGTTDMFDVSQLMASPNAAGSHHAQLYALRPTSFDSVANPFNIPRLMPPAYATAVYHAQLYTAPPLDAEFLAAGTELADYTTDVRISIINHIEHD